MRSFLAPFGIAYGELASLRRRFYSADIIKSHKLNKPVVSVGNLTVGGTGKTPVVDAILSQLESQGKKVCVLTRGYGRVTKNSNSLIIDSDTTTSAGGDEPVWLARRHPKSIIAVGADRLKSSRNALDVDVFLLDDGLQHLQIKRDLDIVLLDCSRPHWHFQPLPWGFAREGLSTLSPSNIVILTRVNQSRHGQVSKILNILKNLGVTKIVQCQIKFQRCLSLRKPNVEISLTGKKVYLVSGIGNPESFESSVREQNCEVLGHLKKEDHFHYSADDVGRICKMAQKCGAEILLLTEKDGVKWEEFSNVISPSLQVAKFVISLEFNPQLPSIYDLATQRPS